MTVSQFFVVFDDLENFKEYYSGVCRVSLNWNLSSVFLTIRLALWVCGGKTVEVKCYSHPIRSRVRAINMIIAVGIDLDRFSEGVFVMFVTEKNTVPGQTLWKAVTVQSPHSESREFGSTSLGQSVAVNYLEFFHMIDLSFLP